MSRGKKKASVKLTPKGGPMDTASLLAVVGSAVALIGVVISMMFWVRGEGNALRKDQKEDRKDLLEIVRAIHDEMKDFHYRLLEIEKSRKG